jgi:cobalamin biosynthesis protein CbiG
VIYRNNCPTTDSPLWVGIGCQRGSSRNLISRAIEQVFQDYQLLENAIAGIATIDTKASEVGLLEFCRERNLSLKLFTSEMLRSVSVPNPSQVVTQAVGVNSVAEAAAMRASLNFSQAKGSNYKEEEEESLIVPKQVFRLAGEAGVVTIAVARMIIE